MHAHVYICICHSVILCVFVQDACVCVCVCVCVCMLGCVLFSVIDDGQGFLQLFLLFGFVCLYFGGLFCFVTFFFSFLGGGLGGGGQ